MTDDQLERYFQAIHADIKSVHDRLDSNAAELTDLRTEMRSGFAALRAEMATKKELAELRAAMVTKPEFNSFRREVRGGFTMLEERIAAVEPK